MKLATTYMYGTLGRAARIPAIALIALFSGLPIAHAQDDAKMENPAAKILKAMSTYVAAQNSISASFDSDIEVITPSVQKIQFTNSGQLQIGRPNKLRVSRTGGYTDVELVFDGTTATVLGRHSNIFASVNAPGTIDQLIDRLRDEHSFSIPAADLLLADSYDRLAEDVIEARHIGEGVIDGVECDHLAFRNMDTDWQLWVEKGDNPVPRKYVITSKGVAGAPQYTIKFRDWKTDAVADASAFVFKAPADARKLEIKDVQDIDEIPVGSIAGGEQ